MTNPIHPWLPAGVRPYTPEELFEELRAGRSPVDPARWTLPFTMKLAPLGVTSEDGRQLAATGAWQLRGGGPIAVKIDDPAQADGGMVVGQVDVLTVTPDGLLAAGVVDPDVDLTGLMPQVELNPAGCELLNPDDPARMVVLLTGGEVTGVKLGILPAFPDVWIRTGVAR